MLSQPLLLDTFPHLDKLSPLRSLAHHKTVPVAIRNLICKFARYMQDPSHGMAWQPVLERGSTGKRDASRWDRPTCYTLLPLSDSRCNRFCLQAKSLLLPLSWCFCRIFLALSLFLLPLVVADGKGCEGRKSLTQICNDHVEVMAQPTPAEAVSKLHCNQRFVLKHFC